MAINLKTVYQETKSRYKLELVAGKNGMDRMMSWVHYMEDSSTTYFIRGSELIITTGMGLKGEDWLKTLIHRLMDRQVCGLMVNLGRYIKEIPKDIIIYCNENNFPLITMPWEIHLVDIMQDYANRIIREEEKEINVSTLLLKAILYPENRGEYMNVLEEKGYDIYGDYMLCVIEVHGEGDKEYTEIALKKLRITVRNILNQYTTQYDVVLQAHQLILIFRDTQSYDAEKYVVSIENRIKSEQYEYNLTIGVGTKINGVTGLCKSYKHCLDALKVAESKGSDIEYYKNIGINKLLLAVEDKEVLEDIYNEFLGKLEKYDKENGTSYIDTLRLYIKYDGSVQAVAAETFTHRNTVNYRIKKTKEIIGCEIESMQDKFNLQLCFFIEELYRR